MSLGALSYVAIVEARKVNDNGIGNGNGKTSWGRVLGRIILPGLLVIWGLGYGYAVVEGVSRPRGFAVGNVG